MNTLHVTLSAEQLDQLAARIAEMMPTQPERIFYPEKEVAAMLGVPHLTLRNWRLAGHFRVSVSGRKVLYRRADIDHVAGWLESRSEVVR